MQSNGFGGVQRNGFASLQKVLGGTEGFVGCRAMALESGRVMGFRVCRRFWAAQKVVWGAEQRQSVWSGAEQWVWKSAEQWVRKIAERLGRCKGFCGVQSYAFEGLQKISI